MIRNFVLVCLCLTVFASVASAADPKPDRESCTLWSEASEPGARRARALVTQAERELVAATMAFPVSWAAACKKLSALAAPLDLPGFSHKRTRVMASVLTESMQRLSHIENAIARLQEAQQSSPDNADVLFTLASALRDWERPGPLWSCRGDRRDAEAIATFERLRALHPTYRPATVAFELAILHTRLLEFGIAARYYAEGAPLELDASQLGVIYGNWAEVTMLAGDPIGAVQLYQRAIDVSPQGRSYLLPLWGRAVALDRLGERDSAREHATRALHADGGSMAVLHSDGVFFEPESEIFYYEALGLEAQAAMPGRDPQQTLEHAAEAWRNYLATGGDITQWALSARDNLQRVEGELARRLAATTTPPATRKRGKRSTNGR